VWSVIRHLVPPHCLAMYAYFARVLFYTIQIFTLFYTK
jgi:hypothetical protein